MQAEDNERREKNLEEAKKIIIENDSSLPSPETVGLFSQLETLMPSLVWKVFIYTKCFCLQVKIRQLETKRGQRVKVFGWVHRLRRQGEKLEGRLCQQLQPVSQRSFFTKPDHRLDQLLDLEIHTHS